MFIVFTDVTKLASIINKVGYGIKAALADCCSARSKYTVEIFLDCIPPILALTELIELISENLFHKNNLVEGIV